MQPLAAPRTSSGFTLVELVVVLTILAVLAATATVSTAGIVDQSRYDATRTTLSDVESAVLGRPGQVDSQNRPWIQGFVADMGRLPVVIGEPGPDETLNAKLFSELWIPPNPDDVKHFEIQLAPGDADVQLPCGWRGPYLRLPLGSAKLLDGWGNPLRLMAADGSLATTNQPVARVKTLGADDLANDEPPGDAGYDADFDVVLTSTAEPRDTGDVPFQVSGTVPVTVSGDVYVVVRLYGAQNGHLVTYDQPFPIEDPGTPDNPDDDTAILPLAAEASIDFIGKFEHVPIGPRAMRVYLTTIHPNIPTDPNTFDRETPIVSPDCVDCEDCVASGACVKCEAESPIQYLTVVPGGIPTVVVNFD